MKKSLSVNIHGKVIEAVEASCLIKDLDGLLETSLSFLLQVQHVQEVEISLFVQMDNLVQIAKAVNVRHDGRATQEISVQSHVMNSYIKHSVRRITLPRVRPLFSFPLLQHDGLLGFMNIQFERLILNGMDQLYSLHFFGQYLAGRIGEIMRGQEIREVREELHNVRSHNREALQQVTALSKEMYAITAISTKINQSMDLQKSMRRGMSKLKEVFGACGVMIYTRKSGKANLRLSHMDMEDGLPTGDLMKEIGNDFLRETADTGRPSIKSQMLKSHNVGQGTPCGNSSVTIVGVPMRSKGRMLGALLLFRKSSKAFNPDNVRLLSGIGNIMGMAIENMDLFQQAEKKKRESAFLVGSIAKFNKKLDLESTLKSVAEKGAHLIGGPCCVYLLTETKFPMIKTTYGDDRTKRPPRARSFDKIQPEELKSVYQSMKSESKSILVKKTSRSRRIGKEIKSYFRKENISSLMMVPLRFRGENLGLFVLSRSSETNPFDRHDLALCEALGSAASVAIQNAWAYADSLEMSDLLERKIREKTTQIQQIHDKQATRLENENDITFWINNRNKFVFVNRPMEVLTGISRENLCNGNILAQEVVAEEDRERIKNCFISVLSGEVPMFTDLEYRHLNRKGEDHILSLTIYPAKELSGRIIGIEGIGRDITEKKMLEAKLEKAKNLALLGEFSSAVAHQIRNPLGNILMGIKLLQKATGLDKYVTSTKKKGEANNALDQLDGRDLARVFEDLTDGIGNLNRVVTELLNYTKTLRPSRSLQRIDLIINETLDSLRSEIEKHNITVEKRFDPNLPPFLVDAVLISQVFQNVIQNAVEAMPGGGVLAITSSFSLLKSGYAEITVRDTGPGLKASETERIFHPMYTTKASGTGLGLSLSHRIVDAHNGSIWARNNPAEGITIHILLAMEENKKQTHSTGSKQ